MAELLVALSIFALISTIGLTALGFMIKTQYLHQIELEKKFIQEFNMYSQKNDDFNQKCCNPPNQFSPPYINRITLKP